MGQMAYGYLIDISSLRLEIGVSADELVILSAENTKLG